MIHPSQPAAAPVPAPGGIRIAQILHPSPASPAANRDWPAAVDRKLDALGVLPLPIARPA